MAFQSLDPSGSGDMPAFAEVANMQSLPTLLPERPYEYRLLKTGVASFDDTRFRSLQGSRRWNFYALRQMLAQALALKCAYRREIIAEDLIPDLSALCERHSHGQDLIICLLHEHGRQLTIAVPDLADDGRQLVDLHARDSKTCTARTRLERLLEMHSLYTTVLKVMADHGRYFSQQSTCDFISDSVLRTNEKQGWLIADALVRNARRLAQDA